MCLCVHLCSFIDSSFCSSTHLFIHPSSIHPVIFFSHYSLAIHLSIRMSFFITGPPVGPAHMALSGLEVLQVILVGLGVGVCPEAGWRVVRLPSELGKQSQTRSGREGWCRPRLAGVPSWPPGVRRCPRGSEPFPATGEGGVWGVVGFRV